MYATTRGSPPTVGRASKTFEYGSRTSWRKSSSDHGCVNESRSSAATAGTSAGSIETSSISGVSAGGGNEAALTTASEPRPK